jgi:phosphoribosylanthranilate isomerase
MSVIQAKICGLKEAGHAATALRGGAAFLGFVIFPKSPRYIAPVDARPLAKMATGMAKTVAVVVNPDERLIDEIMCDLKPDYIQLHGTESTQFCARIRARGVGVIKAFGIGSAADLAPIESYRASVDMILLDAKPPKDAKLPGGLGHTFDWDILGNFKPSVPWFLSGGLTIDNAHQACARTGAKMLDLSSGVESAPGLKNDALITAFLATLKTDT